MTIPVLKIKVLPKPIIKGKMDVRFPGMVTATSPILLDKTGGNFTFSLDAIAVASTLGIFFEPVHSYINQEITAGASANVATNAKTVRVNKTIGSATTLVMPLAATMLPEVITISDWKADSDVNPITITLTGTEKFPGNLSSWTISGQGASIALRPIPGVGFAL